MKQATLADVAKLAGVHKMTVSRVLRSLPGVHSETRDRVLKAIQELHYRPNAMVSALMAQVANRRVISQAAPVALLIEEGSQPHNASHPVRKYLLQGIRDEAEELGIKLETHEYGAACGANRRLEDILYARGIGAAICFPPQTPFLEIDFGFAHLNPVAIGNRLRKPTLHRVGTDNIGNTETLFHALMERGYRRPGLIAETTADSHDFRVPSHIFQFLVEQNLPADSAIPAFRGGIEDLQKLDGWLAQYQPDICLLYSPWTDFAHEVLQVLDGRFPAAFIYLTHEDMKQTGIVDANLLIGAVALRLALRSSQLGIEGIPNTPISYRIRGAMHWAGEPIEPVGREAVRLADHLDLSDL